MSDLSPRQQADEAARSPGFWAKYEEPTPLARAIEMPLHDPFWQTRVLNGYAQTKLPRRTGGQP